MSESSPTHSALSRINGQRLPFLLPLGAAIAGILLAELTTFPVLTWLILTGLAALWFFTLRSTLAFLLFSLSVFGLVHLWQSRDSAAARISEQLATRTPLVTATGTVADEPRSFGNKSAFTLKVRLLEEDGRRFTGPFSIQVEWPGPAPAYGDLLRVTGVLANISPPRNPGQFDSAAWAARRGIYSRLRVNHVRDANLIASDQGSTLLALAQRARQGMRDALTRGLEDPIVSQLLVGMTLGDTSSMSATLQEQFRGTGTFHLFAVSGLHVGILAVLFWSVFGLLQIPRRHAAALIIPILCFYALMTGLKPANTRATVMAIIILIGLMSRRQPVLLNNLLAAAFLILLANTNQLFNPGFQFSFSVVTAIFLCEPGIRSFLATPFLPDPFLPSKLVPGPERLIRKCGQGLATLAAVSVAAWLGSLPLTLGYFHLISFSAIPANLFAVPLAFCIMAVALLSLGSAVVSISLSMIFNQCNWLLAHILIGGISWLSSLPGSYLYLGTPTFTKPVAEVVVFDFGSGAATWLRAENSSWLLDTGPLRRHDSVIRPLLHSQGFRSLDGLLLTHGDAGHIGAAWEVVQTFTPRLLVDSALKDRSPHRQLLHKELARISLPKSIHRAGDIIEIAPQSQLQILFPPSGISRRVADEKTLVVSADIAGLRLLFLSDSGLATERWLLANCPEDLDCDILIKGSPRSGPSGNSAFLSAADPQLVIATATSFPSSEIPSPALVAFVEDSGVPLFRQDECGAVTIQIFSHSWQATGFLNGRQFLHLRKPAPER